MPRQQTAAAERSRQNDVLRTETATELGVDSVTVRQAQTYRRKIKGVDDITSSPIPLDDENLIPVGVVKGTVQDFKTVRGATAHLSLMTNAREFGDVLLDASITSVSEVLVIAMYRIPRDIESILDDVFGEDDD